MTPSKYLICRIAMAFGYSRKNIRMGDAAGETHLLKEAEAFLGEAVWRNVEDIEELSMEYWNIRKLTKDRDRVASALEACEKNLVQAQEERAGLLGISTEPYQDLLDERQGVLSEIEELARERDRIVAHAREIRKNYEGIKTKKEVLEKEGGREEELEKTADRLTQLKKDFAELKKKRHDVAEKISAGDARIDVIEEQLKERKKERREKASEAFQHIGDANQEMSTLRAELGVFDTQMRQLYSEIGRFVSLHAATNADCQRACKEQKGLVDVMMALRQSIQYNHKLAELS